MIEFFANKFYGHSLKARCMIRVEPQLLARNKLLEEFIKCFKLIKYFSIFLIID